MTALAVGHLQRGMLRHFNDDVPVAAEHDTGSWRFLWCWASGGGHASAAPGARVGGWCWVQAARRLSGPNMAEDPSRNDVLCWEAVVEWRVRVA
ncbi:hypothetical protein [Tsukamurella paurometabola]|uniref:hypothetical protein n=1 Tax=Tsukamurella paurometabola TaxID=2061 RepID=UPI0011C04A7F|nr:hypothetical protein [Tsukamurella paurometabola]